MTLLSKKGIDLKQVVDYYLHHALFYCVLNMFMMSIPNNKVYQPKPNGDPAQVLSNEKKKMLRDVKKYLFFCVLLKMFKSI